MKTEYAGLDYSHGLANVDNKTGIHYGVIPLKSGILQSWCDSCDYHYSYHCPHCGQKLRSSETKRCSACRKKLTGRYFDFVEDTCDYEFIQDTEYTAHRVNDSSGIWITKSRYYTLAQFCSPCAPGAGYILNPCENGAKTYCFDKDFFDDGKAPYDIYSVKTGELLYKAESEVPE